MLILGLDYSIRLHPWGLSRVVHCMLRCDFPANFGVLSVREWLLGGSLRDEKKCAGTEKTFWGGNSVVTSVVVCANPRS